MGKWIDEFLNHGFWKAVDLFKPAPSLSDKLRTIGPGEVSVLRLKDTGDEFAVLPLDDFDHIAALANLRRVTPKETATS